MEYVSTRGKSAPLSFCDMLLVGLAPDGGLYVPESYPQLDLNMLRSCPYNEVALHVLSKYAGDIEFPVLKAIIDSVYTRENFGSTEITPVRMFSSNVGLLQLSNGLTLAFKDVALQLVAALMDYVLERRGERLNILGATSGDTGSAAAYAVRGRPRLNLFMLSPKGRMSEFQTQQMYTLNEPNIFNLRVDRPFDDCQELVKEVNRDLEFKRKYSIGAMNSINFARIIAQIVYYVYAYMQVTRARPGTKVTFAVPSGNFGNALAAYIAGKMGLPIEIIVCTNENDVLDEFFRTGVYKPRGKVTPTSSPSMDIQSASNFERLIYDFALGDSEMVRDLFGRDLSRKGQFDAQFLMLEPSVPPIYSAKADHSQVLHAIADVYSQFKFVIDPHTAVAMSAGLSRWDTRGVLIVAETAQPVKFADTIREAIGIEAPIPPQYDNLDQLPLYFTDIEPRASEVKRFMEAHL